uniref:Uncharacterized protein n=1 Tax=Romanomermis culicivorax TaxID=13658 RepID=A0A915IR63_ROMCU
MSTSHRNFAINRVPNIPRASKWTYGSKLKYEIIFTIQKDDAGMYEYHKNKNALRIEQNVVKNLKTFLQWIFALSYWFSYFESHRNCNRRSGAEKQGSDQKNKDVTGKKT